MGKLGIDDFMQSTEALKDFKLNCLGADGYKFYPRIIVLKDDEEILKFEYIEVMISLNYNHHHIDIMWEEKLENFKAYNLYGRYRTDYNIMENSYKELTIISGNMTIVVQG
ncbi:hypothetical protein ACFVAD_01580 [Sutcliffiella sp. NPDC057660]|uniref:hypothetical protein n=1 Tax=Sutcliffiella sp. NPDC057660 TaxID=3346199 RepID=UPI00369D59DC